MKVIDCIADWSECAMPSSVPLPELHAALCLLGKFQVTSL